MSVEKLVKSVLGIPENPPRPHITRAGGRGKETDSWSEVTIVKVKDRVFQIIRGRATARDCLVEGEGVKEVGKPHVPVNLTMRVHSRKKKGAKAELSITRR